MRNARSCHGRLIEPLEQRQFLSAGSLDTSFGTGGHRTVTFQNQFQLADVYASVLQPDGKVVLAGDFRTAGGFLNAAVARLNADGTPDTSFNGTGIITQPSFGQTDGAFGVALQTDGKIVVAAGVTAEDGEHEFYVARLNTDGTPDTTFAGQGFVFPSITSAFSQFNEARAVAIQPDGKIVVAGFAGFNLGATGRFALVRFNTDGSLDQSFGVGGINTVSIFGDDVESALGVALQPDGKIVVTGTATDDPTFITLRFGGSGFLDPTWGNQGVEVIPPFDPDNGGTDVFGAGQIIAVQPDGKVLIAGLAAETFPNGGSDIDFGLLRLTSTGQPDPTFGGNPLSPNSGAVQTNFGNFEDPTSIALQSDGKIIVAGKAAATSAGPFNIVEIARYTTTGALDNTFGNSGEVILLPPGSPGAPPTIQSADSQQNFNQFVGQSAAIVELVPGGGIFVLATENNTLFETKLTNDVGTTNTGGNGQDTTPGDLVIALATPSPASIIDGRAGAVTITISNNGASSINASPLLQLLFSNNAVIDTGDLLMLQEQVPVSLTAGASITTTLNFTLPVTAATGSHFILARINGDQAVGESNLTNNDASVALRVTAAPKVATATLKGPGSVKRGKAAAFTLTIANATQMVLVGSMVLALERIDSKHQATTIPHAPISINLKKKANKAFKFSFVVPKSLAPGKYTFQVQVDSSKLKPAGGLITAVVSFTVTK